MRLAPRRVQGQLCADRWPPFREKGSSSRGYGLEIEGFRDRNCDAILFSVEIRLY